VLGDGETVSATGTHLGHNLPDRKVRVRVRARVRVRVRLGLALALTLT
jgi:hypothetical protein